MRRVVAPIAVLLLALLVLLVPFHPEAVVLNTLVAATPATPFARRADWLLVETGGNLAMFAVVGAASYLVLRRRAPAFAAASLLSAAAELAQIVIPHRVASVTDLATNVVGAGLGVLLCSWIVVRLRRSRAGDPRERPLPR